MEKVKVSLKLIINYCRKNWFIFFAIATYVLFTAYYMSPSFTSCNDSLYGFGDNTAGPIWRYIATDGKSPLWGYETISNYPQGENLYSPLHWTGSAQYVTYWLLAKVAGPVCGYNLLNILGFLFTAIITFLFIRRIFKNNFLALLAGYLVAFTPYVQVKIGGHPSYGFVGLIVLLIWVASALLLRPTYKKAILLGFLFAFNLYFDPYFALYGSLALSAVMIGYLVYIYKSKINFIESIKTLSKYIGVSIVTALIVVTPFLINYFKEVSTIQSQVAAVRGNVMAEAAACSNYPHEYLVPFVLHPITKVIGIETQYKHIEDKLKGNFSCGIGEDTVGISLALISVVVLGATVFFWDKLNGRKSRFKLSKEVKLVIYVALALLFIGLMFGLPPTKYFGIPTPNLILLHLTTTWRTMTRIYILVNLAVVILGILVMYLVNKNPNISKRFKYIAFAILLIVMFVEYQTFMPFKGNEMAGFSYSKSTPEVYSIIKKDGSIKSIAEFPMESYGESDAPSYYLSFQVYHKKHILNSPSPISSLEEFRKSIKNLSDPQTLPALRALGVDAIVVHGVDDNVKAAVLNYKVSPVYNQPSFTLLSHTNVIPNDKSFIVYLGSDDRSAVVGLLSSGFYRNLGIIHGVADWAYEAVDGAKINLKTVSRGSINVNSHAVDYCFDIRTSAVEGDTDLLLIIDGMQQNLGKLSNQYRSIRIKAINDITLSNSSKVNMQVQSLGCPDSY